MIVELTNRERLLLQRFVNSSLMKTQNSGSVTVQKLEILYELQEKQRMKKKILLMAIFAMSASASEWQSKWAHDTHSTRHPHYLTKRGHAAGDVLAVPGPDLGTRTWSSRPMQVNPKDIDGKKWKRFLCNHGNQAIWYGNSWKERPKYRACAEHFDDHLKELGE